MSIQQVSDLKPKALIPEGQKHLFLNQVGRMRLGFIDRSRHLSLVEQGWSAEEGEAVRVLHEREWKVYRPVSYQRDVDLSSCCLVARAVLCCLCCADRKEAYVEVGDYGKSILQEECVSLGIDYKDLADSCRDYVGQNTGEVVEAFGHQYLPIWFAKSGITAFLFLPEGKFEQVHLKVIGSQGQVISREKMREVAEQYCETYGKFVEGTVSFSRERTFSF